MTLTYDQIGPSGPGTFFDAATPASPAQRQNGRAFDGLGHAHNQSPDGTARSTTSLTIGTGLRTFAGLTDQRPAVEADFLARYRVGQRSRVYHSETRWMEGTITERTFTSITINVDTVSGSGTYADWYISPIAGGSWLQYFDLPSGSAVGWDYFEDNARRSVVSDFGIALAGVSRTNGLDGIGAVGAVYNTGGGNKAWGAYFDGVSGSEAAGITHGVEINATALHTSQLGGMTPYKTFTSRMTGGANVAIGSDAAVFGRSHEVDWTMMLQGNGGSALAGIVFRNTLLRREGEALGTALPGAEGYAQAILLPYQYGLSFYSRDSPGGAGEQTEVVRLFSSVTNPARRWRMSFTDGSFNIDEGVPPGNSLFRVNWRDDATSFVAVSAGGASSSPQIAPGGAAANINLLGMGKGTGHFGFGVFTADDDAPITGYVEIVTTDGVVRKLAVID